MKGKVRLAGSLIGIIVFLFMIGGEALGQKGPTPQRGGILRISYRGETPTLNIMMNPDLPAITFAHLVFSGLVMIDPTQEEVSVEKVVPALAEKWEISSDGKIYTFSLRKGVKFHDGHPFTAKDAKYSLDFYRDPSKSAFALMVSMIEKVEIVNDYTIKVSLEYPFHNFLLFISYPYLTVLPAHLANVNPKNTEFLVGTGPFIFKKRTPGKVWEYGRNPDYFFSGLPYFDGVEIYIMPWPAAIDAFCGGRLDMAGNLRYGVEEAGGLAGLEKIRRHVPDAIIKVMEIPVIRGIVSNVSGLQGRKGPWQDVRVRRAMALLIDYPGTIMAAYGTPDLATLSGIVPSFVSTGLSWEEVAKIVGIDKPWEQRIAEAKRLMKEAGYPNGFKCNFMTKDLAFYWKTGELMAQAWKEHLNIQTEIQIQKNTVYYPARDSGDFELVFDGMRIAFGGAPEETLSLFMSGATTNYGKWSNPEYDKLYNDLLKERDPKKRKEISIRMQRIFHTELPSIIVLNNKPGVAYRPSLHGHVIQPAMTNWACIDRMWKEK